MKPVFIEGIGILSTRGRGLNKFEQALQEGWVEPTVSTDGRKAYRVPKDALMDYNILKKARRSDRFSRLAVFAACDAIHDSGLDIADLDQSSIGIIIATAFGPHATVFKVSEDIIDYGEKKVSPTTFAHSIHNAAASYVASALGCTGPVMTTTQFYFSFQQALLLASSWLDEGRLKKVLVGTVDECSPVMEYICEEKLSVAYNGKMRPFSCLKRPKFVPGEGSAFFLVSHDSKKKKYGAFTEIKTTGDSHGWTDVDLSIIGTNAMGGSEEVYKDVLNEGIPVAAYSSIYGGFMTGNAFECVAAALMLKNQKQYASSNLDGTEVWNVVDKSKKRELNQIQCISHNNKRQLAFIKMMK
jgi:3-oxoacyl-[acyl-carrier-protein] synthase II